MSTALEVFANPAPERDYTIRMTLPEFTCLCPKTGQPDFATLKLEYVADERCVELKSLKLYVWSFRSRGAFHEAVTNEILATLVARDGAAIHAPQRGIQRARGDLYDRDRRASAPGLDAGAAGLPASVSQKKPGSTVPAPEGALAHRRPATKFLYLSTH